MVLIGEEASNTPQNSFSIPSFPKPKVGYEMRYKAASCPHNVQGKTYQKKTLRGRDADIKDRCLSRSLSPLRVPKHSNFVNTASPSPTHKEQLPSPPFGLPSHAHISVCDSHADWFCLWSNFSTIIDGLDFDLPIDHSRPTLRDSLLPGKPYVPCQSTAKGNTRSAAWTQQFELRAWLAFNIRTLNESYGCILDQPLPLEVADMVPSTSRLQGLVVADDNGPKHIIAWNDKAVMPLVKYAKRLIGLHVGMVLHHEFENVEDGTRLMVPGLHNRTTIGHAITLGNYQRAVLVVGLSRTSVKWRGSALIKNPNTTESEPTWPIRQLANLCSKTGTRYGYIQTDEELVVCCFAATKSSQGEYADWKVFAMSVPWNMEMPQPGNTGARSSLMSTELALWWLCMLSMSDDNRSIVEAKDIVPIDTWDTVHLIDKNTWVHRHRYSGFEKPAPLWLHPSKALLIPFSVITLIWILGSAPTPSTTNPVYMYAVVSRESMAQKRALSPSR